jgi:hypothetical protein
VGFIAALALTLNLADAAQTQVVFVPDRANVEAAHPYDNPRLECKESLPALKPWTEGKFLERSANGNELIAFADGNKYWFAAGDFFPLYRVTGTQPVEIRSYRASHDDEGKLKWEIKSLSPPMFLKPGDVIAIDPAPLQLVGLFRFHSEDGRSGIISLWDVVPAGDGCGIED